MAIPVTCPQCEATIRASDKYAGKRVKCPKCGGAMVVPSADEASLTAESPGAAELPAANSEAVERPSSSKNEGVPSVEAGMLASQGSPAVVEQAAEQPLVRIEDEGERWRKAVTKKSSKAGRKDSPSWLWPVVGVAALVVVAGSVAFWKFQPAENDVALSEPPAKIASTESVSNVNANAAPSVTQQSLEDAVRSEAVDSNSDLATLAEPTGTADAAIVNENASGNENVAAMTSTATMPSENDDQPEVPAEDAGETIDVATESSAPTTPAEEVKEVVLDRLAEEVLEEHGIRIVGDQAALTDESTNELRTALRDAQKLKASLGRTFAEAMKLEKLQKDLKAEYGIRSAALAQVNATRPNDATTNNVLVGQLSAIETRVDQLDEQIETARRKLAESREAYIEHLLKTRGTIEKVQKEYEQASADPEVKAALAQISKEKQSELSLEPLGSFYRAQQDLEKLEEQILSDTITARVDSGNLFVSTMINGEHTIEMIVDSGASVVTLPYEMAVAAGVKPKESDPVAQFQIADGSLISGQMITIPSLRVGKFTVENVEAAVLDPKAIYATPLLGMSFLGKFETKIDSERGQLVLSKIEGAEDSQRVR